MVGPAELRMKGKGAVDRPKDCEPSSANAIVKTGQVVQINMTTRRKRSHRRVHLKYGDKVSRNM
uniref:Protein Malvolio n=1 Tax=Parascaris univalens TaxID=6257 RepID=A0A914ZI01_PARUN